MKLALNYSPAALELLQEGAIDVDLIKCAGHQPDTIPKAQLLRKTYVHFPLNAGTSTFAPDWKDIEKIMKATGTRFLNLHLEAISEDHSDIPILSQEAAHQQRITEILIQDVNKVTERFGAENVIIEGDPYHAEARASFRLLRASAEPQVISEVVRRTGCGFLLDIDHARVSSHYMNMKLEEYVAQLPTDRLKELHMTGTRPHAQEGWLESHHEMQESDWPIFDWAMDQIHTKAWPQPDVFAFEYGGIGPRFEGCSDKVTIAQQVPIFREKINALGLS